MIFKALLKGINNNISLECEPSVALRRSSGVSGPSVLSSDCDTAWRAPEGGTGPDAQLILDLKCSTQIETISFINMGDGNGSKDFSIYMSDAEDGPWSPLINGTLEQGKNQVSLSNKSDNSLARKI